MKSGLYINKTVSFSRALGKYLTRLEKPLVLRYSDCQIKIIISKAETHYLDILPKIPFVNTTMYDKLLVLNSKMVAFKNGKVQWPDEVQSLLNCC